MTTLISVLYGLIGIVLGYAIPDLSFKIMVYKKGKDNIEKKEGFLYSKWVKSILSISNGVAWVFFAIRVSNVLVGLLIGILVIVGLVIAFIDIQIRIIPNELVMIVAIIGIVFQVINYGMWSLLTAILSMFVMLVAFSSVAGLVGLGKVGAGDIKLAGAMGLALGYPLLIIAIGIMSVVLLAFIIIGFIFKKISLSTMLPLAPFMISGFVFALITVIY